MSETRIRDQLVLHVPYNNNDRDRDRDRDNDNNNDNNNCLLSNPN